jgi:hypothetical protein
MNFIDKILNKINEEALNYRARDVGELQLDKSDISDANIQKIISLVASSTGKSHQEVQDKMQADMNQSIDFLKKAPVMCKNSIENAAAAQAFYLIQDLNLDNIDWKTVGVERKDLLDIDVFFELTERVIVENADFFPLRNPFEPRSVKPFFFVAPDDLFLMTDPRLKANSQGDFTAFCTPDAKMVFNRNFSERLALYSVLTGIKSKSKKYISNGGKFPDWYEYIEFVIVHELLHFSVGDHFYTENEVKSITSKHPEIGVGLAHNILNQVGDFINNWTLVSSGYAQLPIGLFSEDINYDRLKTRGDVIEAVIQEYKKLNPEEQKQTSDELSKQQDDHVDNSDQKPSQGGEDGEPSKQEGKPGEDGKPQDGKPGEDGKPQEGKPGEGKPGEGKPGEGKPGEDGKPQEGKPGEGKPGEDGKPQEGKPGEDGKPQEGKPGEGKPQDGKPGEGKSEAKSQSEKIEDAMRKAQEKMANKDEDSTKKAQDVLNKTSEDDGVDNISQAKKTAKEATTLLDTAPQEDNIIDWRKLLKKMIPTESFETEDTYSKMSRSTTSSMVTVAQTGTGRIQPGEILTDPEKKSLLFIIDNSGSVMSEVSKFNSDIIKLLEKNKDNLDNFFVMKFSDDFDLYKVDVKAGTFQQIQHSEYDKLFDKKGKKLAKKIKVAGETKKVKTDLFKYTFGGGTYWKPQFQFIAEAFFDSGANIVFFTDDDLASSDKENFKKFYKLGNKKRGQVAMFITDERSFKTMKDTFGTYKWVTVFK